MNVFLFPGQGSQEIGMGADLFKNDVSFRELIRHATDLTGVDLENVCLRGPERELTRPDNLQPLLVCVSLGYLRHLTDAGIHPDLVLGHSVGEITALAAAGIVTAKTAVALAAKRGELMTAAAAKTPGGLLAVIGGNREEILLALASVIPEGTPVLANDNTPDQFILSGSTAALEQARQLIASRHLAHCRRLAVAGPWHSPLMAEAYRAFVAWLAAVEFQAPQVPLRFNITGGPETDPQKIRDLVARNIVEPVLWRKTMAALRGVENLAIFEIGPGRILSGLARANGLGDPVKIFNINNLRGVELATTHR